MTLFFPPQLSTFFSFSAALPLQISFIRRRDFHILTNGHNVYTRDERIEIFHAAKSHDWYLVIKRANHNDSGIYECQVKMNLLKSTLSLAFQMTTKNTSFLFTLVSRGECQVVTLPTF